MLKSNLGEQPPCQDKPLAQHKTAWFCLIFHINETRRDRPAGGKDGFAFARVTQVNNGKQTA